MKELTIPFVASADYSRGAEWVETLQRAMPGQRIVAFDQLSAMDRRACTVAIVANPDPAELCQLPQLRWVHSVWAGVDQLVADFGGSGWPIVRLVDPQLTDTMVEAVLAWTLYLHRDMPAYAMQQRQQQWLPRSYTPARHRRIGLLGLGKLGEAAAARLTLAGFTVCGWSRSRKSVGNVDCYAGDVELDIMLSSTDILVCLLPLTASTRGLLGARKLACLPPGASLINFARGAIVNDDDLRAALDSGRLKHAVLDVFVTEPLPPDQWQWRHPSVTVLPHCSASTDMATASLIVAATVRQFVETGELPKGIDLQQGY